jgi:hypothetical protein
MSPEAGKILVDDIVPRIRCALARGPVRAFGAEDHEEVIADTVAVAARILHRAEATGRTPPSRMVAHYALQSARAGHRFNSHSVTNVLNPGCALRRKVKLESMDAVRKDSAGDGEGVTLHDLLADKSDDPATLAGRRIDWREAILKLNSIEKDVLCAEITGRPFTEISAKYGMTAGAVTYHLDRSKKLLTAKWSRSVIAEFMRQPFWKNHVRAFRETMACRAERALACP